MPELANPVLLLGTLRYEQRNSKSTTRPLVQIRKVLPFSGLSAVVWPWIAPSLTDHNFGLPSQPLRLAPSKRLTKPASSSAARAVVAVDPSRQAKIASAAPAAAEVTFFRKQVAF